jgi:hypothetical protein
MGLVVWVGSGAGSLITDPGTERYIGINLDRLFSYEIYVILITTLKN